MARYGAAGWQRLRENLRAMAGHIGAMFRMPRWDDPVQPFQLAKFFSFTGLVVFLVSILALSWVISTHARRFLFQRSEAYAFVLAENLNHQIFSQFVLPTLAQYGKIALRDDTQYKNLNRVVSNTVHGMNVERVTIFDSSRNIISYSTDASLRGMEDVGGDEYGKALEGERNSVLDSEGTLFRLIPGGDRLLYRLKTYIPMRMSDEESRQANIMGVIEIVQDLSEEVEAIIKFQGSIFAAAILIMAGLFIALRIIVVRSEQIIEERARERRRMEEKLNEAERLAGLGKMITSVSHEIKNPLGIVRSTAEILCKRLRETGSENTHLAGIVIEETIRLDGVVREFLDFARPAVPRLGELNLNGLLQRVAAFIAAEAESKQVAVRPDFDPELPLVTGDGELLYRAFLNIVINALQAMPEGGSLLLRTRRAARDRVDCEIADTGKGMDAEVQRQIFEPFFTNKHRGTGLGLAIVKNIVEGHGGSIAVESAPGEGALFRVSLPVEGGG